MNFKLIKHNRPCAECGKLVEVEEMPGVFSIDIVFCSPECSCSFWKRDYKMRMERGVPPLRDSEGNIFRGER